MIAYRTIVLVFFFFFSLLIVKQYGIYTTQHAIMNFVNHKHSRNIKNMYIDKMGSDSGVETYSKTYKINQNYDTQKLIDIAMKGPHNISQIVNELDGNNSFNIDKEKNATNNSVTHKQHKIMMTTSTGYRENSLQHQCHGISVALGMGLTTKLSGKNNVAIEHSLFFKQLLPSFCRTLSSNGYCYTFYIGYDYNDQILSVQHHRDIFIDKYNTIVSQVCPKTDDLMFSVKFVKCNHKGKPAWAQNDAMMTAHMDNNSYYFMVNDDTIFVTLNWTNIYINHLKSHNPPNVGVVGPKHGGGNTDILTYQFVHRTHFDIFNFFYPRIFTDWWADDWISKVYTEKFTEKIENVKLIHTMENGQRYQVNFNVKRFVGTQIHKDRSTLTRWMIKQGQNFDKT